MQRYYRTLLFTTVPFRGKVPVHGHVEKTNGAEIATLHNAIDGSFDADLSELDKYRYCEPPLELAEIRGPSRHE